jgi:hypothetical protein
MSKNSIIDNQVEEGAQTCGLHYWVMSKEIKLKERTLYNLFIKEKGHSPCCWTIEYQEFCLTNIKKACRLQSKK